MESSTYLPMLQVDITNILLQYRMTPNTSTGRTPFELMKQNEVRTPLSLLHPSIQRGNEMKQQLRVSSRDNGSPTSLRTFLPGDEVLIHNKLSKTNEMGKIVKIAGNNTYTVEWS